MKKHWKKIRLADKLIMIIMAILLLYLIINIFDKSHTTQVIKSIDVVIRTTVASIFGYFISSNFAQNPHTLVTSEPIPLNEEVEKVEPQTFEPIVEELLPKTQPPNETNRLQIIIVGSVCFIALIAIFCIRYLANNDFDNLSELVQFRDIISGSVGFLIGIPAYKEN